MSILSADNIHKQYANHKALDGVSLEVAKGSILGLLGPNGAGKTSLIRIINQITYPDEGSLKFNGETMKEHHVHKIGYLPEERGLYKKMKIGEQVMYLARLKGLEKSDATEKIKHWFTKLEIESWWDKKIEELSKGMQQKVQFIATVMHEPELLILDEPFTGFDPLNTEIIKNEILALNDKGTTVIFSTHRMETVEELCQDIVLINKAKKVMDGNIHDIKEKYKSNIFYIEFNGSEAFSKSTFGKTVEILTESEKNNRRQATFKWDSNGSTNDLLKKLTTHVDIRNFREVVPSIHEIFINKVGEVDHE